VGEGITYATDKGICRHHDERAAAVSAAVVVAPHAESVATIFNLSRRASF
jgi:hypothetical protein